MSPNVPATQEADPTFGGVLREGESADQALDRLLLEAEAIRQRGAAPQAPLIDLGSPGRFPAVPYGGPLWGFEVPGSMPSSFAPGQQPSSSSAAPAAFVDRGWSLPAAALPAPWPGRDGMPGPSIPRPAQTATASPSAASWGPLPSWSAALPSQQAATPLSPAPPRSQLALPPLQTQASLLLGTGPRVDEQLHKQLLEDAVAQRLAEIEVRHEAEKRALENRVLAMEAALMATPCPTPAYTACSAAPAALPTSSVAASGFAPPGLGGLASFAAEPWPPLSSAGAWPTWPTGPPVGAWPASSSETAWPVGAPAPALQWPAPWPAQAPSAGLAGGSAPPLAPQPAPTPAPQAQGSSSPDRGRGELGGSPAGSRCRPTVGDVAAARAHAARYPVGRDTA